MKHRYLDHHPVCGGKIHTVSDGFPVIDYIVVSQHNAFWKTGCPGGVLHIAYIVFINAGSSSVYS